MTKKTQTTATKFDIMKMVTAAGLEPSDRYTVRDVARILGLPVSAVRAWVKTGRLACITFSPRTRFVPADALAAFVADAHKPATKP